MIRRPATLIAALLALAPLSAQAASVWTAVASEKILPAAKARASGEARIAAAKNEFESFQVVVTGPASNVSVRASDLTGPGRIQGVKLYREALINLTQPSAADGQTGRVPDALVPDVDEWSEKRNAFPFDVPAGESRAVWVEVFVPAGSPAGEYTGTVTVSSSAGETPVPVKLTVWDFELPSTASLKTAFVMSYPGLPAAHGIAGGTTDLAKLRQRYGVLGLDHRISISKFDDGAAGLPHFQEWYGALLDGTAPTRLAGAKLTSVQYTGANTAAARAEWVKVFKANGWFDRLFDYTCDEPPLTCSWTDITARAAAVKAADPAFRTLVTTNITEAEAHGVTGSIDLMVPVVNHLEDRAGFKYAGSQLSKYAGFLAKPGKELWTYQSCMSHSCGGTVAIGESSASAQYYTGWPSYMIDASAVRARAQEWLSFRWGATGELYFETTMAFSHDPWNNQWDFSGNGDGTLFYPGTPAKIGGTTHIPVASIRLKMIREGMEDFEYLKRLASAGDAALAKALTEQVFPNAYTTDASADDLMLARERAASRILELEGKSPAIAGASGAPPVTVEPVGGTPTTPAATDPVPSASPETPASPATPGETDDVMAASAGGGCSSGPGNAGLLALLGLPLLFRFARRRRKTE